MATRQRAGHLDFGDLWTVALSAEAAADMGKNLWGWVALALVAVVSVATSRARTPQRVFGTEIVDTFTLNENGTASRRYIVRLTAAANIDGGMPRTAILAIPSQSALFEIDGGYNHTPGAGPIEFNFAGGGTEVPLFENCGIGVDCEDSAVVETRLVQGNPRTGTVSLMLQASVKGGAFGGTEGLSIVPE